MSNGLLHCNVGVRLHEPEVGVLGGVKHQQIGPVLLVGCVGAFREEEREV
jgi:hypothetical protein